MFFQKAWQFFSKHGIGASGGCCSSVWPNTTPCGLSCVSTSSSDPQNSVVGTASLVGLENPENQFQCNLDHKIGKSQGHSTIPTVSTLVKSLGRSEIRKANAVNDATVGTGISADCFLGTAGFWQTSYGSLLNSICWLTPANFDMRSNLMSHVVESKKYLPKAIQLSSKLEEIVLSSNEENLLPDIVEEESQPPKTKNLIPGDCTITAKSKQNGFTSSESSNTKLGKSKLSSTNVRIEVQQMMAGTKLVEQLQSEALNEEAISILRKSNCGSDDLQNALKYLKQSVNLGNSKAMFNLAVCLETGKFGEQNYSGALELYEKAWLNGNEKAGHNLKLLKQDMLKLRANKLSKLG